jgi:hypothetical protein
MGEVVMAACERAEARALTASEAQTLEDAEMEIERGLRSAGDALRIIRDQRLYRATHSSFETYCRERWRHSVRWAHYQIAAAIFDGEQLSHSEWDSAQNLHNMGTATTPDPTPKLTAREAALEQIDAIAHRRWEAVNRTTTAAIEGVAAKLAAADGY